MTTGSATPLIFDAFVQPALSGAAVAAGGLLADRLGQVVSDVADVEQCVRVILGTPRGSVPHRPEFGAGLQDYIDWPMNLAKPHLVREVVQALAMWEPRLRVIDVAMSSGGEAGEALACVVSWRFADGVEAEVFATDVSLGAGASVGAGGAVLQ
jgi:phage baseplate assembly protein W